MTQDGAFNGGSTAASARGYSRNLNGEEIINKSLHLGAMDLASANTGHQKIPRLNIQPMKTPRANATGPISLFADSINDND